MPDGKPTKAPLIIFGGVLAISITCITIVLVAHSRRTEPYLDTKMRRVKHMVRPAVPETPASKAVPLVRPQALDAGATAAAILDAAASHDSARNTEP